MAGALYIAGEIGDEMGRWSVAKAYVQFQRWEDEPDETPIEGAMIQIDGKIEYSDSEGKANYTSFSFHI